MEKFYCADEIIKNNGINKDSAFEALSQDCFGEYLRIVSNGTFYNGGFLHGGLSGNPVEYGDDPEEAYNNMIVREDVDIYESGELVDTRTVEKCLCDVIHW